HDPDCASKPFSLTAFDFQAAVLPLSVQVFHQARRTMAQPKNEMPMMNAGKGKRWRIMAGHSRALDHLVVKTRRLVKIRITKTFLSGYNKSLKAPWRYSDDMTHFQQGPCSGTSGAVAR